MNSSAQDRQGIVESLRSFMVGPYEGDENEVITAGKFDGKRVRIGQTAADLYHTGILYPSGSGLEPEEAEQEQNGDAGDQSGVGDGILTLANATQQSAMGFTFRCPSKASKVEVEVAWGEYCLVQRGDVNSPWEDFDSSNTQSSELAWRRRTVANTFSVSPSELLKESGGICLWKADDVKVYGRARAAGGAVSITLAVVNEREQTSDRHLDRRAYQSEIAAKLIDGQSFVRVSSPPRNDDTEAWNYELLFYDESDFALGHGVSASWDLDEDRLCRFLKTSWIPDCEVFKASSEIKTIDDQSIFEMRLLGDPDRKVETISGLRKLADAYADWIRKTSDALSDKWRNSTDSERAQLAVAANRNLDQCTYQLERLRAAISDLESGAFPNIWESFVLANQAMRSSMVRAGQVDPAAEPRWRPFQLAFILIALRSSIDPGHAERDILDLIWFPTGGGKTEAYLGLSCAVIFHRRLTSPGEKGFGTTVVTRYTLRLLTLQQFERAARVIFACELMRRSDEARLGEEPISIGLYAGKDATPNKLKDAKSMIDAGVSDTASTTLPIDICPWCSTPEAPTHIEFRHQKVDGGRVLTCCPNEVCPFHLGMPFWCVDDELYAFPPTFLIGTVDKFAQLTWEPRSSALLKGVNGECRPPAVIIQDELHLISDSLGSITGLYETALDVICEAYGAIPKVIGSTATIKKAEGQSRQLFNRRAVQFPSSGIEHTDSFFYREDRSIAGRMYVGIHAQGRSPKHTLPRTMALLKQFALEIADPNVRDKFHTLVCYFNSLRELGGALVLAEDDAPRYLDFLDNGQLLPAGLRKANLQPVTELTSNLKVPEIRAMLKQLSVGITDTAATSDPIGLVLSTNMISVGVDVDRLGAMIVNGQPKTTAEYIQASSRVGRPTGDAGLVVTIYNWTRPRDRSHYERFVGYHRAFYRHVEALTVTPFSPRARDKALHSVFFAIARHLCPEISSQNAVGDLTDELIERLEGFIDLICKRVELASDEDVEEIRSELINILNVWIETADIHESRDMVWSTYGGGVKTSSVVMMGVKDADAGIYKTPLSMRDVDAQCPVMLRWKSRGAS